MDDKNLIVVCLIKRKLISSSRLLAFCPTLAKDITFGWWWTGTNSQSSTSKALTWIQCKLGKQYLVKKFTLPWESNPGPTPIRGDTATLVASVGLKKKNGAIRH